LNIIVAIDEEGGIGRDNKIPWRIPEDLKLFKQRTIGKYVIMGRRTFESIGKPLPGRTNIVLSETMKQPADGSYEVFSSLDDVLEAFGDGDDMFIIGGERLYNEAVNAGKVASIFLTKVPGKYNCHVHFQVPSGFTVVATSRHFCEKSGASFVVETLQPIAP